MDDKPSLSTTEEPAASFVGCALLGGALLAARGRDRRGTSLLRLAGLALIGVAAAPALNQIVRRTGERRRTFSLRLTTEIGRPVADVFAFFKNFENYPRVLHGLRSVVDYDDGRSHWEAYSPSGEIIQWSAVVTKYVPNSVIAIESVAGGDVEASTTMRFVPLGPSRTRLEFEANFRPLHTRLHDAISAIVGPPAVTRVRADIERARFYLESLTTQEKAESS